MISPTPPPKHTESPTSMGDIENQSPNKQEATSQGRKYEIVPIEKLTSADLLKIMATSKIFPISAGPNTFSTTTRENINHLFTELRAGTRFINVLKEESLSPTSRSTEVVRRRVINPLDIKRSKTNLNSASKVHQIAAIIQSATGEVTRKNLAEHMQQIVSKYYGAPFPHRDKVLVEHEGKQVPWRNLSPQQKFDVVYEHSLPHSREKLKNLDSFSGNKQKWSNHIERHLFRRGHDDRGNPIIDPGMEHDPRRDHGSDHGMRVGIFSAVYAALYNKYDPTVNLTPEELITIQLAGALHDSGRQTEGVGVDDAKSAENVAHNFELWGFSQQYIDEGRTAISGKDNQQLATKSIIAKCVQCADSKEYERVGSFDPKYLDIHKEFNGYKGEGIWNQDIAPKKLKMGRTLTEFNHELKVVNDEMKKVMWATSSSQMRKQFSESNKNYYAEIVKVINPQDHPTIHAIFTELGVIGEPKTITISSVTTEQIHDAQNETQPQIAVSSALEKNGELFPVMLSEVKFVARIRGTTGAEKVQDEKKINYAKKITGTEISPEHLKSEYHTNRAYQALGVKVPEVALYHAVSSNKVKNGEEGRVEKPIMLSKFVPEGTQDLDKYLQSLGLDTSNYSMRGVIISDDWKKKNASALKDLQEVAKQSFVADCLLANWNVAGLEFDNIRYDPVKKELWRIDNGAGLDFRAQGGKKSSLAFTTEIKEFETLRDPKMNLNTTLLFATLSNEEIIQQIDDILPKREAFLATIPNRLKDIMTNRFLYLEVYKNKLIEEQNKLPSEIRNFIQEAEKDITKISIVDLEKGLNEALKVAAKIKDPGDKTTLLTVAERIAQSYISGSNFDKALEVRLEAAQAITPAPPLADLRIALQKEDPKLGLKLYPIDTSLFKNHTLGVQKRKYTDGPPELHFNAKLSHPARQQLETSLNNIKMDPIKLLKALPKGFCTDVKLSTDIMTYQGKTHTQKNWGGGLFS